MSGRPWLAEPLADAAAERILAAAEDLFAEHGPGGVGMAAVAAAAGCSRATLYRHFASRRALQTAIAHREAAGIVAAIDDRVAEVVDPSDRAVTAILAALDGVRSRPALAAWISPEHTTELLAVLRDSPLIEATTVRAVSGGDAAPDHDRAHWFLRCLVSLLAAPASDPDEERRLVVRFVAPLLE